MKIAFIHYHLKTGGVTTVLSRQIKAIFHSCETLILTGSPSSLTDIPCETVFIPGLGYDNTNQSQPEPKTVARSVIAAIRLKWKNGCDVLHVHNPTLAKNKNFLKILKLLQKSGIKLFLQIHDFAEDGRPFSYFPDEYVSNCHYGVINSRDYRILLQSGLKAEGVHRIFNTVKPIVLDSGKSGHTNRILYPVRAIRRKNVGEAILLSCFFKQDDFLTITLPPNSPADIKSYKGWKTFVKENHLKIEFEAGIHHDFKNLVCSSKYLITTSIMEGFGFSFLEPWTADKLLWGRYLPDICHDFKKNGLLLDHLYPRLIVPLKGDDKKRLYKKFMSAMSKNSLIFNIPIDQDTVKSSFKKMTSNQTIDFGLLDEHFQKKFIYRIIFEEQEKKLFTRLNPFLAHPGKVRDEKSLVKNNKNVVLKHYNKTGYQKRLLEIYRIVSSSTVHHKIDKKRLLSHFFNLESFSLLKWENYIED